ncbi:MAG: hypothetical protein ACRCY4_03345 [Brevinema sp.]
MKNILVLIALISVFYLPTGAQTLNNAPAPTQDGVTANPGGARSVTSQRIPVVPVAGPFLDNLANTSWVASNIKRKEDFYLFFQSGTHSITVTERGGVPSYPERSFPIKTIAENPEENSATIIVASQNRLLYYSFRLITPYYLLISAGYETPEALEEITLEDYFNGGYALQLVY